MKGKKKIGDIVYYIGEHEECHGYKYRITRIYDYYGFDYWYNLVAVNPDILTHWREIDSVEFHDIVTPTVMDKFNKIFNQID